MNSVRVGYGGQYEGILGSPGLGSLVDPVADPTVAGLGLVLGRIPGSKTKGRRSSQVVRGVEGSGPTLYEGPELAVLEFQIATETFPTGLECLR